MSHWAEALIWIPAGAFAVCWFAIVVCGVWIVFHRRPGTSALVAAHAATILLQPDAYTERGQQIRRRYIALLKCSAISFALFGVAIVVKELLRG